MLAFLASVLPWAWPLATLAILVMGAYAIEADSRKIYARATLAAYRNARAIGRARVPDPGRHLGRHHALT